MSKLKTPKIEEMLDAGVHFGHQVRRWNPKMEPYIYTVSKNAHILDLEQTEAMLSEACNYLYEVASKGGRVVFVGTKKQARQIVESEAKRCGAMYVKERWIGGTVTNFKNLKKTIDKFLKMIKDREDGKYATYTKKEQLMIDRQTEKFQMFYGGIASMKSTFQALFVIDPKREKTAIREAKSYKIPVVALVDTNGDPSDIQYVIPGNDDALKSIALIVKALADAVEAGYKVFETNALEAAKASAVVAPIVVEASKVVATPVVVTPKVVIAKPAVTEVPEVKEVKEVKEEKKAPVKKPVAKKSK